MVTLDNLMAFLNDFTGDAGDNDPYMPNGLQVRGREQIKLLLTGVSASQRLFEEAVARNADALLVPRPYSVQIAQVVLFAKCGEVLRATSDERRQQLQLVIRVPISAIIWSEIVQRT